MSREFTYGFDELEIAPGLMAWGEADFQQRANGSFEMIGLSLYYHPKDTPLRITSDAEMIWQLIEKALIALDDKCGLLSDAYNRANAEEIDADYWRDERIERMRIGLI